MTAPLVVLAAGGTGGHVFPAEALAAELAKREVRLAVVTDRRGDSFGGFLGAVETHRVRAGGIAGKRLAAKLLSVLDLGVGMVQAWRLLGRLRPRAVIGFGGYASVPTMLAASRLGIATALHEQNAILGRANRLLAPRARRIAVSFAASQGVPDEAAGRVVHTGMPVRPAVAERRGRPYPALAEGGPINLLVIGGSQGARVFGEVLPAAVGLLDEGLRRRLRVSQQCRPEGIDAAREAYRALGVEAELAAFFTDLPERLAVAHLLIARAGASTVAEAAAIGRPAVLVPYPHAIDDHQSANAQAVDEAGAGWLMPEPAFTPAALAARLASLLMVPALLGKAAACAHAAGRPDAAARLADVVCGLLNGNGRPEYRREAA